MHNQRKVQNRGARSRSIGEFKSKSLSLLIPIERESRIFQQAAGVRRQRSLDRTGGLKKGEFLAHRNVHRSEDETANSIIEGAG